MSVLFSRLRPECARTRVFTASNPRPNTALVPGIAVAMSSLHPMPTLRSLLRAWRVIAVLIPLTLSGLTPSLALAATSDRSPAPTADTAERPEEAVNDGPPAMQLGLLSHVILDKPNAGLDLRIGETLALKIEATLLWTSEPVPQVDASFLGTQFGAYLEGAFFSSRHISLNAGLGVDMHALFNVHPDFFRLALAPAASATFWLAPNVGLAAGVRAYPLSSQGLELGRGRDGARTSPLLMSVALRWRVR